MEDPVTSTRSGSATARSRNNRATDSGFVLDIAGLPILVRTQDDNHLAVVNTVFGPGERDTADPRAELSYRSGRLDVPEREPDEHHPDLDVWHEGDVLHLASEFHEIRARITPDGADIVGIGAAHERSFRRIFQPVITHLLAYHEIFVIHAASMRKGDLGVLALGETGKGKSTLALAALQSDWHVMGDDLAALRIVDGVALIRGLPKAMALPNDLTQERSEPLEGTATLDWDHRGRLHVPSDRLDLDELQLGAILVVEHGTTEHSTLEPMSADAVASMLMGSYTSVGNSELMRRFFPIAVRAARVSCWTLHHGTESSTRLRDAQQLLSELADSQ